MKEIRRLVAFMLVLVMVCTSLPSQSFANQEATESASTQVTESKDTSTTEKKQEETKQEDSSQNDSSQNESNQNESNQNESEKEEKKEESSKEEKNDSQEDSKQEDSQKKQDSSNDQSKQINLLNDDPEEEAEEEKQEPVTFVIKGSIVYDNKTSDGRNWKSLIQPSVFNNDIILEAHFADGTSKKYIAQNSVSTNSFYLKFVHDGDGGGDFTIVNVPKEIDGKNVSTYELYIDEDADYYKAIHFDIDNVQSEEVTQVFGVPLKEEVVAAPLDLLKKVEPEGSYDKTFTMDLTFKRLDDAGNVLAKKTFSVDVKNEETKQIMVPLSIQYEVKEKTITGYRLTSYDKQIVDASGDKSREEGYPITPVTEDDKVTGTSRKDYSNEVTVTNRYMDYTVPVEIKWIDNGDKNRRDTYTTQSMVEKLTLQYKTADGEWAELTDEKAKAVLDIDAAPACEIQDGGDYVYAYKHLPTVDTDGNAVDYRVIQGEISGYKTEYSEDGKVITNTLVTDFHAVIDWYDDADKGTRPSIADLRSILHLYSNAGGEYKEIDLSALSDDQFIIEKGTPTASGCCELWNVTIKDLATYTESNQLNEYFIIQGTLNTETGAITKTDVPIPEDKRAEGLSYRSDYDNGSGAYGNVDDRCYDGGAIHNTLKGTVTFKAYKKWNDSDDANRPKVTVTLWRYAVKDQSDDKGIDGHIASNAARVIVRQGNQDYLLSYTLSSSGGKGSASSTEEIVFDSTTISGLGEYELPKYDERGYQYVYFVQETYSNSDGDYYQRLYTSSETSTEKVAENGTYNGGYIINTRKEKVEINLGKEWASPATISDYEGTSIQFVLVAKKTDGTMVELTPIVEDDNDFTELTGDEAKEANTIHDFTKDIKRKSVRFYVNAYDEDGQPYNFANSYIKEVAAVDQKGDSLPVTQEDGKSKLVINDTNYVGTSFYGGKSKSSIHTDLTRYDYSMRNVIQEDRNYDIIKHWQNLDPETYHITAVYATLTGVSDDTSAQNPYVTLTDVRVVKGEDGQWIYHFDKENNYTDDQNRNRPLQRYDENGYLINYKAKETKIETSQVIEGWKNPDTITVDGETRYVYKLADATNLGTTHEYTIDQTDIYNYITGGPSIHLEFEKHWKDDGDDSARKTVELHVYDVETQTDLSTLNKDDPKYVAPIYLNKQNVWYDQIWLSLAENKFKDYTASDFVVKEVSLNKGEDKYNVEYSEDCDWTTGHMTGRVSTDNRNYRADVKRTVNSEHDASFDVTNIRSAYTDIYIEKTWIDGQNYGYNDSSVEEKYKANRPSSIKFQLRKDGQPWHPSEEELAALQQKYDIDANGILTVGTGEKGSGDITEKNTATGSTWKFRLSNLEKYDEEGVIHYYDFVEIFDADSMKDYVQSSTDFVNSIVSGSIDHNLLSKTFTNKKSSDRSFTVYKKWYDEATGGKDRPDIYLNLYRKVVMADGTSSEEESVYEDQSWQAASSADKETYDWKVMISSLPTYNEEGYPYIYYVKETMNNNGESPSGKYQTQYRVSAQGDLTGHDYAEDTQFVVNSITDNMIVTGIKRWENLDGFSKDELPVPGLVLYQYLADGNSYSSTELDAFIAAGADWIKPIDRTTVNLNDNNHYSFPSQEYIQNHGTAYFPKYNEKGQRYLYYVKEMSLKDHGKDISYLYQVGSRSSASNRTITNIFNKEKNQRAITVTKEWDRSNLAENEKKIYPSVTFELYRAERTSDAEASSFYDDATKIDSKTITADTFMDNDGQGSAVFENLLVFSPRGYEYYYYVKEKSIEGYTSKYYCSEEDCPGHDDYVTIANNFDTNESYANLLDSSSDLDASVKCKNTYVGNTETQLTLTGKKIWNDYSNSLYEGRPSEITLTLSRYSLSTSGQHNGIDKNSATEIVIPVKSAKDLSIKTPYIVWTDKNTNTWSYSIYNLPKTAPNGNAYIYILKESSVDGYKSSANVEISTSKQKAGVLTATSIVNSFDTSYALRKNWIDGNDKYGLRPTSATFYLQRKTDSSDWANVPWNTKMQEGDSTMSKLPTVDQQYVSIALTKEFVMANTKGNSWKYTFSNLPKYDTNGQEYSYRCVETKVGEANVTEGIASQKAGAYNVSYSKQDQDGTTVENDLRTTSLYVKKTWDDQDNAYESRPSQLTFLLQKTAAVNKEAARSDSAVWENVTKDGEPYVFTLTSSGNWETELQELPVCTTQSGEALNLYFRAVEVYYDADNNLKIYSNTEESKRNPSGARNYLDVTDYSSKDAWDYNNEASRNESHIKNQLIPSSTQVKVTLNKTWKNANNDSPAADLTFELQYSNDKGNSFRSYNSKHTQTLAKNANPYGPLFWDGLPEYDREGNKLTYRIVETAVTGYKTEISHPDDDSNKTIWNFTNIEKRGVVSFTKAGNSGSALISHKKASNDSKAYFGVYTDKNCTKQVAGMAASSKEGADESSMILVDYDKDGNALTDLTKEDGSHYRRMMDDAGDSYLALLSGTYYLKELRAPAGYKLNTTVYTITIPDDRSAGLNYKDNQGSIANLSNGKLINSYNQLTLYKMDQFGAQVTLGSENYLLLTSNNGTLSTGESSIRLYQSSSKPCTKADGSPFSSSDKPNIAYNSTNGTWTFKGFFDGGREVSYTISEASEQTPADYVQAAPVTFTMNANGKISISNSSAEATTEPGSADGSTYKNTYKSTTSNNQIVLRDIRRYYKGLELTKQSSKDQSKIANISFKLYQYTGDSANVSRDAEGKWISNDIAVLGNGALLTTDSNGKICLDDATSITNTITGKALSHGLTIGKYYLLEQESGSSDSYKLKTPIYFTITSDESQQAPGTNITLGEGWSENNVVANDPVEGQSLSLIKVGEGDSAQTKLSGAEFTLKYVSVNDGQTGSQASKTYNCYTNQQGILLDRETSAAPDISLKGNYTLVETKAPAGYMTRKDGDGKNITLLTFTVNSENKITKVSTYDSTVTATVEKNESQSEDIRLSVTVSNKKTKVYIDKTIDSLTASKLSGVEMEIYRGSVSEENKVFAWTTNGNIKEVTPGLLEEGVSYILHEKEAPVGYLEATDITFTINGTTTKTINGQSVEVSKITVTSSGDHLVDKVLTMVDETIKLPVTLRKVRRVSESDISKLADVTFDLYEYGSDSQRSKRYECKTNSEGFLVDSDGSDIVLQQNQYGYVLVERSAPSNAYNDGREIEFNISDTNYLAYRSNKNLYLNVLNAGMQTKEAMTDTDSVVNEAFKTTASLHKYDEISKNPIKGATFTLYKGSSADASKKMKDYTSDKSGNISISITEKGTYTLVETAAATGYQLPAANEAYSKTFTVTDAEYDKTINLNPDDYTLGVVNERLTGQVTLCKVDGDTKAPLSNVTFTLYKKVNGNFITNIFAFLTGKQYKVVEGQTYTGEELEVRGGVGQLTIKELTWAEYKIVESVENDGYVKPTTEYTFTIDANHLNEKVGDLEALEGSSDEQIGNVNNYKNSLTVKKTDMEGTLLTGATFQILDSDGQPASFYLNKVETGGKVSQITAGQTTIYGLKKGTYTLHEVKAPLGYELTDDVTFTMKENGSIQGNGDDKHTITASSIEVKDVKIAIYLAKADSTDSSKKAMENSGAVFKVTGHFVGDAEGSRSTIEDLTPENFHQKMFAKVIAGEDYEITETTAATGYQRQTQTATFHVNEDGRVSVKSGSDFLSADDESLTFVNDPIGLSIVKADQDGTEINQTKYGIAKFTVRGIFRDSNGVESSKNVTANDARALTNQLIVGNVYTVTETEAPKGYKLASPVTFTVNDAGKIATIDGEEYGRDSVLTIKDDPIVLTIKKLDASSNQPLANVKLKVTGTFADTEASKIEWTTNGSDKVITRQLIAGNTYQITEVERAAGYEILTESIEFTVANDGKVSITKNPKIPNHEDQYAASLSDSGIEITVYNMPIAGSVVLTKTAKDQIEEDGSQKALSGAVYELYQTADAQGKLATDKLVIIDGQSQFTTDNNGKIQLGGLEEGSYYFIEVDAPAAYHINNDLSKDKISFDIQENQKAHVSVSAEDEPIKAKLEFTKYSEGKTMKAVSFEIFYKEPHGSLYESLATVSSNEDGKVSFDDNGKGLKRGFYRIVELKADGQMNTDDSGNQNAISFEIGNESGKTYTINSALNTYLEEKDLQGIDVEGDFLSIDDKGLVNTPIPEVDFTAKKVWKDDESWINTLRTKTIKVQLYVQEAGSDEKEPVGTNITLGDENAEKASDIDPDKWQYTWEDLPEYRNVLSEDGSHYITKKLTYFVEEVEVPSGYINDVTYSEDHLTGNVNNTLIGGDKEGGHKAGSLKLQKNLGGGSARKEFKMTLSLSRTIGEKTVEFGTFKDKYTVYNAKTDEKLEEKTASDGYVRLKGDQYAVIPLPAGMEYKIVEDLDLDSNQAFTPEYTGENGTIEAGKQNEASILNIVHKRLDLSKISLETEEDGSHKVLDGIEFRIDFTSLDGNTSKTIYTRTNEEGKLFILDGDELTEDQPVLTEQGTYQITETKTKDTYVLPTDENGNPLLMVTITVGQDHHISITKSEELSDLVSFEISEDNDVATIIVSNQLTSVKFKKVDKDSREVLSGATFVIKEGQDIVTEWVTGDDFHEVKGLKSGVTYTLEETYAPLGYDLAQTTTFKITEGGRIDPETTTLNEDGILTVEDQKKASKNAGQITVEKQAAVSQTIGEDTNKLYAEDQKSFLIGLFTDEAGTNLYGGKENGIKEVVIYRDTVSTPAVWDELQDGVYYVYEVDADGNKIAIDGDYQDYDDHVLFYCTLTDSLTSNRIVIDKENKNLKGYVGLKNVFDMMPEGFTDVSSIKVTKQILKNGQQIDADRDFYVGVFDSPTAKTPIQAVRKLENNESIIIEVPADPKGGTTTYYVYETDEEGNKVDSSFEYNVTVSNGGKVTTSIDLVDQEVTITNNYISIDLLKVDADNHKKVLEGVEFQITDSSKKEVARFTTEAIATEIQGLKTGETYTLTEISAPKGYKKMSPITFTVDENGEINNEKLLELEGSRASGNHCYLIENKKIESKKKDSDKDNKNGKSAKTSDSMNLALYLSLLAAAVIGLIYLFLRRKKNKE